MLFSLRHRSGALNRNACQSCVRKMLAFVVLFTIFVGLVALYVLFTERKTKVRPAASTRVYRWLDTQGAQLPSVENAIDILNGVLSERKKSASWDTPTIASLLPGTPLPQFSVQNVELETDVCFNMICDVSWPTCAPGLEISVVETVSGKRLSCHLQANMYKGKARIALERDTSGSDLLISFEHVSKPAVMLSCVVVTPGVKDPESLASEIADSLQEAFMKLKFSRVEISSKPHLTGVEVTPPVEVQITPPTELDEKEDQDQIDGLVPLAKMASGATTPSETAVGEATPTTKGEGTSTTKGEATPTTKGEATPTTKGEAMPTTKEETSPTSPSTTEGAGRQDPQLSEADGKGDESVENTSQDEVSSPGGPGTPSRDVMSSTPASLAWKRTPSYEQLHVMPTSSTPLRGTSLTPWDSSERLSMSYAGGPSASSSELSNLEDTFSATSEENYPSTLVYEVGNPGHLRHLVAISTAHAKKLHRNFPHSKKLHLYNDHFFIATHTKHKHLCAVCGEKLSGMFGKQGYQCRECQIWVHKPCHIKMETPCPNSKSSSINLIYPDSVSTASKY